MAYTLPLGNAADFTATGSTLFPMPYDGLRFKFDGSAYTPPAGGSVSAQFPADPPNWTLPAGDAANFIAYSGSSGFEAVGAFSVGFEFAGVGEARQAPHTSTGAVTVGFDAAGEGAHGVAGSGTVGVGLSAAGSGAHGVAGSGTVGVGLSDAGSGAHGVAGSGDFGIGFVASGAAVHERYELRGEVRMQGILVNRRVRVYDRATGGLVGQSDTTAGRFSIHAGFSPTEYYIVPIDLSETADDFSPPIANRVASVLAMDAV